MLNKIDIEELKERILRNVNDMRDNFPNLARNNSGHASIKLSYNEQVALLAHLKALEQQQSEIEQLKKDSDFQNAEIEGLRRTVDMWKTNELKKIRLPKPPEKK